MLDQILAQLPVDSAEAQTEAEIEPLIAMGEQVLAEGDAERALSVFEQIAEIAPDHPEVVSGRVRALVAAGRLDEAEAALAALPEEAAKAPEIDRARAALDLARVGAARRRSRAARSPRSQADPDEHAGALRPRQRADGGGRARRRGRFAARDHRRGPRLERGRGARAVPQAVRSRRARGSRGCRRSAGGCRRSCSR